MKILYYSPHPHINSYGNTGASTHIREMAEAFRVLGHEVQLLIIGGDKPGKVDGPVLTNASGGLKNRLKKFVPKLLWETLKDRALLQVDARSATVLESRCRSFKPDLIYERGYYLMTSGIRIAKKLNIRHVLELNAPYVDEREEFGGRSLFKSLALRVQLFQLQQTDRIVVVSSPLKSYFEKLNSAIASKICITPNAINPAHFAADASSSPSLRAVLSWGNVPVIGFVGSIFPYHGVEEMIKAYRMVCEEKGLPDSRMLIVGDGMILNELIEKTKEWNLQERIHFTGQVPYEDVKEYIREMDITVLAGTNYYMSPIKLFEYGALGKAIIAPDQPSVCDVLTNGENALLVAHQSIPELAAAMKRLIVDNGLRKDLGNRFREKVFREHTWVKMAERVLQDKTA